MKTALPIALAVIAYLGVMAFAGCLGPKTKMEALLPPAQLSWPAVQEDYERGIADGLADGELSETAADTLEAQGAALTVALDTEDLGAIRLTPWPAMRPWAQRGIDTKLEEGEIGPTVATSLEEQLVNFSAVMAKLKTAY